MASTKSTIAITLAALAAGAALGILFAPDPGKGILKSMKNDADELADDASNKVKQTKDRAKEAVHEVANGARAAAKN